MVVTKWRWWLGVLLVRRTVVDVVVVVVAPVVAVVCLWWEFNRVPTAAEGLRVRFRDAGSQRAAAKR